MAAAAPGGGGGLSGASKKRRPPSGAAAAPNPVRAAEAAPASKRRKKKPAGKALPERVAALVPESALYSQLLELERQVDATLARKKLDIQEALKHPPRSPRILRVYVFNTHANQPQQQQPAAAADAGGNGAAAAAPEPPSWTLHIVGRLVDNTPGAGMGVGPSGGSSKVGDSATAAMSPATWPGQGAHGAGAGAGGEGGLGGGDSWRAGAGAGNGVGQKGGQAAPFSSFVKRLHVQLDPAVFPDSHSIAWDGMHATSHVDGFEMKRQGSREFVARVSLDMKYAPERLALSRQLADLLGVELETRPRIISALWQYVKARKLQDPSDASMIECDAPLLAILGEPRIKLCQVASKLQAHLSPPPPVVIEHHVHLSGPSEPHAARGAGTCYDFEVDAPAAGLDREMAAFLGRAERHADVERLDELIAAGVRRIDEHRRRRAFFLGFSAAPVEFINALVASQSRDLRQAAGGEAARSRERERRSDFYTQPWVEDAVVRYLNRRLVSGVEGA
eukprot:jgi/Mesen1/2962/ME000176S02000